MSPSDIVTPQNHPPLEQENEMPRCLLKQQNGSPLQKCEQACDMSSERRLLEATAIAANALLTIAPFDTAVNTALQILGESLETDRVKILECVFDQPSSPYPASYTMSYEWVTAGTISQLSHPGSSQISNQGAEAFMEQHIFQDDGFGGLLQQWPESYWSAFEAMQTKGIYCVPIRVEGQRWGVLVYDDCREAKRRNRSELTVLRVAADCIGSAIQRQRMQRAWEGAERQVLLEREKAAQERAAELAKANAVLRGATDRLASEPSLEAFLGHILTQACQDAIESGVIFLYEETQAHLVPVVMQGVTTDYPYSAQQPVPIAAFPPWSTLLRTRQPLVLNMDQQPELFVGDTLARHRAQGHQGIVVAPLMIGDRPLGVLGIASCHKVSFKETDLELFQALAQQATLAIQLTRLAEEAKQAEVAEAIAREQKQAAQEQAAELAKANTALQRVIDALTDIDDLDEFVPATLRIVAQTFETENCAFYEHSDKAPIYLRYWLMGDRVLRPDDLITLNGERFSAVRRLAAGFTIPDSYLGKPVRHRSRAVTLNHTDATSDSEFNQFVCENDWAMELNVPLLVDGYAEGALVIYRSAGTTYTPAEIGLAEALGKQLALAMQASRLATEKRSQAVETAIAREQEKAAQERAAELVKVNEALKRSVDVLATETDLNQFIGHVLQVTAEQFDAPLAEYWQVTNPNIGNIVGWWGRNQIHGFGQPHDHPAQESGVQVPRHMLEDGRFSDRRNHFVAEFDHAVVPAQGEFIHEPNAWYASFGVGWQLNLPLIVGETCFGVLNFWQPHDRPFTEPQIELGYTLAQQVTLAIRLSQLAEEAKQAAIAREQEKAAQERAAELAKANEVLRRSLDALVAEQTLPGFLGHVLTSITHQLASPSSVLWLYDREQRTANLSLVFNGQTVKPASQTHHPNAHTPRDYSRPERAHAWEAIIQQRQSHLLVVAEETRMTPSQRDYLLGQGIWGLLSLPLVLGDRTEGTFAIHFHAPRQFREEELELVQTLANQAALAIQMAQLAEQAKDAALLEERNRLAGEIHDTLAQAFTGISMQLSVAKWLLQQDRIAVDGILDRINDIAQDGLAEAQRSVWTLYPVEQVYADLAQQLSRCVEQMTSGTPLQVDVQIFGSPCPLSPLVGKNLLRIGQEAITNTLKHAQATVLKIHLTYTEQTLRLCVQDNGCGFLTDSDYPGFGLISMSDRADRIGGQLSINSQPGQGTETKIQVPLP